MSYLERVIRKLSSDREGQILRKHGLEGTKYVCIMNQFWRHKNHIVMLKAMKVYFSNHQDRRLIFVFAGQLSHYRTPDYIEKLKRLFREKEISLHSRMRDFIERTEQIAI